MDKGKLNSETKWAKDGEEWLLAVGLLKEPKLVMCSHADRCNNKSCIHYNLHEPIGYTFGTWCTKALRNCDSKDSTLSVICKTDVKRR